MQRSSMIALIVSAAGLGGAQQVPALTVEESLQCAGLFSIYAVMPENQFPGMVQTNLRLARSFLQRAKVLAERRGEDTDDHLERATAFSTALAVSYEAAADQDGRRALVTTWGPLTDRCEAGADQPL